MNITILGRGAWGRALGALFAANGHVVTAMGHTETVWPNQADLVVVAIPVQHIRGTLGRLPAPGCPILNVSKGLEIGSGRRVSEVIAEVWPGVESGILSGPTLAEEVTQGLPAAAAVAAANETTALFFQQALHQPKFRLYHTTDLIGVELGGALKNIYAIAGGVCEGLKLGENARAGLLARSLAEMTRLGVSRGGRRETFSGLSGTGDLVLTATSSHSRNFRVGHFLAQGLPLPEALQKAGGVVEGVSTVKALVEDGSHTEEIAPVAHAVYATLYRDKSPAEVVQALLTREAKAEG
jgi:glycerol-3-phosphate dehydrogenase (NAD(P)+)